MTALRAACITGLLAAGLSGRAAAQVGGSLGGDIRSPRLGPVQGEVSGQADWAWNHRLDDAAVVSGDARIYAALSRSTALWLGRGIGSSWALGRRRPLDRTAMGATAYWGRVRLGLSINSTVFDPLPVADRAPNDTLELVRADTGRSERRTAYTDAFAAGGVSVAGLLVDLSIGRRFSKTIPEVLLWGISASRPVAPGVALLASVGRSGTDPITALPGSRYFFLGLRLSAGLGSGSGGAAVAATSSAHSAFRIGPARLTGREIVLRTGQAARVELAGDFTDWRPVDLEAEPGGAWRVVLPIPPGVHRVAVRVDGGPWQAPPGTRPAPSEFGAEVGEVMVE